MTGKLFNPRRSGSKVRKTGHSKGHNTPFKVTSYTHNDLSISHYVHPHLRFDHSSVVLWAEDEGFNTQDLEEHFRSKPAHTTLVGCVAALPPDATHSIC